MIIISDIWNETTTPEYIFAEVVLEAVDVLAYEYVQKNKGKRPTEKMISEWTERLLKERINE